MARRIYDSPQWRRTRTLVLARDNYRCQIRKSGCTETATCVDHIMPVESGGSWFDPSNLRAACLHCNSSRVNRTAMSRKPYGVSRVFD